MRETISHCPYCTKVLFKDASFKDEADFETNCHHCGKPIIVCVQKEIPGGVLFEKDWRTFKLESVNDLHSVGVIASLSKPLADAGISIFNVSTYQTNYIMVEEKNLNKAIEILSSFCEIKK